MIQLHYNDVAASNHFLSIKDYLKQRIRYVLNNGIIKNKQTFFPKGQLRQYLETLENNEDELKLLITSKPDTLRQIAMGMRNHHSAFTNHKNASSKILYNIFITSIYEDTTRFDKHAFIKEINLDTCPYCNRGYIYYLPKEKEIKPQIDHYYPKSIYPFLGISYYNLIPSCQTCNGFGAKMEADPIDKDMTSPYLINNANIQFSYAPVSSGIFHSAIDKTSIKLEIKNNIPGNFSVFKLEELYQQHADHVIELIIKSKIKYSATYRDYLKKFKGLKFNDNEIDRMILGNYASTDEIHKRPLAKLYQDIGKSLGLIK